MRVLVTGARGFLGTQVRRELLERWPGVTLAALGDPPEFDLRDPEVIQRCADFAPDMVFHLAAQHFVPWCREHPAETLEVNTIATTQLLQALPPVKTFVFASSAAVYGLRADPILLHESTTCAPDDVYGLSKLEAEGVVHAHAREGARMIAARLFNLVGLNDPVPHLFPILYRSRGGTAPVDETALRWARDFTHVEDAARSLVDLAAVGPAGFTEVNVCTGIGTTGWDLVRMLRVNTKHNPKAERAGGGNLVGNPDRLYNLTGRTPTDPFERLLEGNRES